MRPAYFCAICKDEGFQRQRLSTVSFLIFLLLLQRYQCLTYHGMANLSAAHIKPQTTCHRCQCISRTARPDPDHTRLVPQKNLQQPISSSSTENSTTLLSNLRMSTPFPRHRDNFPPSRWECCLCAKEGMKTDYPHTIRQCNKHKPPHKSRICCRGHQVRRRNSLGMQGGGSEPPSPDAEHGTASQMPVLKPQVPPDFEKEGRRRSTLGGKGTEDTSGREGE